MLFSAPEDFEKLTELRAG